MSPESVAAYTEKASQSGTAAAALVAACQDTIDNPQQYATRGGADGDYWPGSAVRCAFAYVATKNDAYLTQALKYWHASLDDDQDIGDGLGCVAGVSTDWQSWSGDPPAPPVIRTITHDTGYPMRWYGPDIALAYDWLHDAPGVDSALLAQTRTCLTAWIDYYTDRGYHNEEAGANYNAGYVIGKTLGAIAIGDDGGADGHLWTETTDTLFPQVMVAGGLAGLNGTTGDPAGPLVGGDWAEGWQYGPLSILEYAVSARALQDHGASQSEMSVWGESLVRRYYHGLLPDLSGQWVGGDYDDPEVYTSPNVNQLDAVLVGLSSDQAASWAAFAKQAQSLGPGDYVYNAFAEIRPVAPEDYRTTKPALHYIARGTRALYTRTSWEESALWSVFTSAPAVVSDHQHLSASNFVLNRGPDPVIVDPSNYGEVNSLATNAVTADSTVAQDDYFMTQTPWSQAELRWARGTDDAVFAARSDFADAFIFADTPSDIPYAHREWVFLPEGEIVTIDRVRTASASQSMYVGFHVATSGGGLTLNGTLAEGTTHLSKVAIHQVLTSGGTAEITQPEVGDCSLSCSYPCGQCDAARFPVDKYTLKVPGPWAVAVHVIDALEASDQNAVVASMNGDPVNPDPQNTAILGASVLRGNRQSYIVASSAEDGVSPETMTYGVFGDSPARHIVFDAPEDAAGKSKVTTSVAGDRCLVTITAGDGMSGHPLMFTLTTAANGCKATESTSVDPAEGGAGGDGGSGGGGGFGGGGDASIPHEGTCGCAVPGSSTSETTATLALLATLGLLAGRRRKQS